MTDRAVKLGILRQMALDRNAVVPLGWDAPRSISEDHGAPLLGEGAPTRSSRPG